MARIRELLAVDMPLRTLFEAPTVAALAEKVELEISTGRGLLKPPIERVPRDGPLPFSYLVERRLRRDFWNREHSVPTRPQNIHMAVHWSGPLNHALIEQSVNEIVRRHEILRTNFATVDGEPSQFISQERTLSVPLIDLRPVALEHRRDEAMRVAVAEVVRPFDLRHEPLLRMTLVQVGEQDYLVVFVVEHIVFDGWSTEIFFNEFITLYKAFAQGQPSPLSELPFQYVDYSHWQRTWLQGEVLENLVSYWRKQLKGYDVLPYFELPVARPRPELQSFCGEGQSIVLSPELSRSLKVLSRQQGATIFMLLLAALKTLFHRHTGLESIGVISPTANRTWLNTEGLIGWFAQTLVLRTDLSGNPRFSQLLERVREVTLGAFTHQDVPLPYLIKELSTRPPDAARAVPHIFFNLDNYLKGTPLKDSAEMEQLAGVAIREAHIDTKSSEAGFGIHVKEHASAFDVLINYEIDCYDASTIRELLEHFESLLEGIVADPEQHLSDIPLRTRSERQALVNKPGRELDAALS
jgi:non-ribosomal peptide synthetase component F